MAIVKGPLMSLSASGQIAKTLVCSKWKGIKTMRSYVVPANPQSAGQTTQRGYFSAAVNAFRLFLLGTGASDAWNRLAGIMSDPMSGFNAAVRQMLGVNDTNPDASFAYTLIAAAGATATATMKNIDDGATGDEAGNFDVYLGSNPSNMSLLNQKTIGAGVITLTALGATAAVVYVSLVKDGVYRSGIYKLVVLA